MAATPDVWIDVQQERQALLCLVETLTPIQWDSPSLYSEWQVRDVVGLRVHWHADAGLPGPCR